MGIQCADVVYYAEGNMCIYRYGEILHSTAVLERQSCYTMTLRQLWESLYSPPLRVRGRYANQRNSAAAAAAATRGISQLKGLGTWSVCAVSIAK